MAEVGQKCVQMPHCLQRRASNTGICPVFLERDFVASVTFAFQELVLEWRLAVGWASARQGRKKRAQPEATAATEDTPSGRPARPRRPGLRFESSSEGIVHRGHQSRAPRSSTDPVRITPAAAPTTTWFGL